MLPVRAQALAAAQHPRRVCHQVKGVMAVLLAARGDEPDRGGQIRRNPGQMYEPPLLAAVTLVAPPART